MTTKEKLSVLAPHDYATREGIKTRFLRVGTAFAARNGGYDLVLDSLPAPQTPQNGGSPVWRLLVRHDDREGFYGQGEPRRGQERDPQRRGPPQHRDDFAPPASTPDDEDNIPF